MEVLPLLTHLVKHVADPRHSDLFIGVANKFLDIYGVAVREAATGTIIDKLCSSFTVLAVTAVILAESVILHGLNLCVYFSHCIVSQWLPAHVRTS